MIEALVPYDKANPAHRQRVTARLSADRPRVPSRAVDTFIAVFNRVHASTRDEGRAIAAATSVVDRRFPKAKGQHAANPAMVSVGRALAIALGRRTLQELELTLQNCDCGKDHARTLRMLQFAVSAANRAAGSSVPPQPTRLRAHSANAVADPFAGVEAKNVGANIAIVWQMIARDIYASGDKVFLAIRELLQNSRDAKARNIEITWKPDDSDDPDSDGTLTFRDDGKGMDRATVEEKFLVIGESGADKRDGSGDALGGFGAAKAAILTTAKNGWSWSLWTRDVLAQSADQGMYRVVAAPAFLQGAELTFPGVRGGETSTPLGRGSPKERIVSVIACCDLRGINVRVNGALVQGYFEGRRARHAGDETMYESLDWGAFKPEIKSYARMTKSGGVIIVRVKGLAQFAVAPPHGAKFERDWVLDFEIPKGITPHMAAYPFKAGRDAFRTGSDAYYAFDRMRDRLFVNAASGVEDLGEYEEIQPDSTDPREQKAQQQFNAIIDSVLGSDKFADVLTDLMESADEMSSAVHEALAEGAAPTSLDDLSVRPGTRPQKPPPVSPVVATLLEGLTSDDFVEQLARLDAFVQTHIPDGDVSPFRAALDRLRRRVGYAADLEIVSRTLTDAVARAAPSVSALAIGGAVSRILRVLEAGVADYEKSEVAVLKKKGQINPFGEAACIFIHRERFGAERGKEFRKQAKKYMRLLVAWDFVVRAVLTAANASPSNMWPRLDRVGVGFVLDPNVLGLTRNDGKFVMVNPFAFEKVAETYRDRGFVVAAWVHGTVCHEVAHAMMIQASGNGAHNTDFSILRENLADETLFLLPVIEDACARLLKLRKRRVRRPAAATTDVDGRVEKLETALAEAQTQIDEYKAAEGHRTRLLPQYSRFAHRLDDLIGLYDFREWLRANPKAAEPYGVDMSDVLRALDARDGGMRVLELLDAGVGAPVADAHASSMLRSASSRYMFDAEAARDEVGALLGSGEAYGGHSACPGCGGTCGGAKAEGEAHAEARKLVWRPLVPEAPTHPPS